MDLIELLRHLQDRLLREPAVVHAMGVASRATQDAAVAMASRAPLGGPELDRVLEALPGTRRVREAVLRHRHVGLGAGGSLVLQSWWSRAVARALAGGGHAAKGYEWCEQAAGARGACGAGRALFAAACIRQLPELDGSFYLPECLREEAGREGDARERAERLRRLRRLLDLPGLGRIRARRLGLGSGQMFEQEVLSMTAMVSGEHEPRVARVLASLYDAGWLQSDLRVLRDLLMHWPENARLLAGAGREDVVIGVARAVACSARPSLQPELRAAHWAAAVPEELWPRLRAEVRLEAVVDEGFMANLVAGGPA